MMREEEEEEESAHNLPFYYLFYTVVPFVHILIYIIVAIRPYIYCIVKLTSITSANFISHRYFLKLRKIYMNK